MADVAAVTPHVTRLRRVRTATHRPQGALWAVGIILALHGWATLWVYPQPMPRRDLRAKLDPLTAEVQPVVMVAGDSRAECGLIPRMLAERLGIPKRTVINIGTPACDMPGVLAAYRAYAERLHPDLILLVSVSVAGINDGALQTMIGDETLWSLRLRERWSMAPPGRVVQSLFFAEREWMRRNLTEPLLTGAPQSDSVADQGYRGKTGRHAYPPDVLATELRKLGDAWYARGAFAGARWRLFRDAVATLRARGVQVVIVDPPVHPRFSAGIAGTSLAPVDARYHEQLAGYCADMAIPYLRVTADELHPAEPADSFISLMHLNRSGAERMSRQVADQLAVWLEDGVLHLPANPNDDTSP
jgi:hypothetical protein